MSDIIEAPEGAQAVSPGRFGLDASAYGRSYGWVFEPGLAELSTATMTRARYAQMVHPEDTRGIAVLAHRETYTRRDGSRGYNTVNAGSDGSELRKCVDVLEPFSMTMSVFRKDPRDPDAHRTRPCKATWNLAGLGACWLDLDYYKRVAWRGRPPEEVASAGAGGVEKCAVATSTSRSSRRHRDAERSSRLAAAPHNSRSSNTAAWASSGPDAPRPPRTACVSSYRRAVGIGARKPRED